MSELKACDLYGGRDKVIQIMTDAFKEAWLKNKDKSKDVDRNLVDFLHVSPKAIARIMAGESMVDYRLFDRMSGWLELNIWSVLGPWKLDDAARAAWDQEMIDSPMYSTGPAMNMTMYLCCRLVSEADGDEEFCREWWRATPEEFMEVWRTRRTENA